MENLLKSYIEEILNSQVQINHRVILTSSWKVNYSCYDDDKTEWSNREMEIPLIEMFEYQIKKMSNIFS